MSTETIMTEALSVSAKQAQTLIPYLLLSLGVLLSVVAAGMRSSRTVLKALSFAIYIPFVALLLYSLRLPDVSLFGASLVIDPMTRIVGAVVGTLALVVSLFAKSFSADSENSEWLSFMFISVLALSLLPACSDFVSFFVVLETASISGYLLAASDRKRILSLEAGLKYLLTGAFASAFLLMGFAQLYGQVGSLDFSAIQNYLSTTTQLPAMVSIASVLIIVAFAYKVGLAPFHMWSPDVYQGGPTALSAFLATATKVSLFSSFAVALYATGLITVPIVTKGLYGFGLISVIVGSLMALVQGQLKRMLAYSGVANAGYACFALISGTAALSSMFSFLCIYSFALIVGFAFAEEATIKKGVEAHADVDILSLGKRGAKLPVLSKALFCVAIFSLAGIPPFPGFLAKYQILSSTWAAGYTWGAAFILLGSLLGIGYYLRTLVPVFMQPEENASAYKPMGSPWSSSPLYVSLIATLVLMAVLVGFSRMTQWTEYVAFFAR